ncbi:MAG: pyridoxine 5-phosphate synthase [Pseudomonadota bacterium]|jgi:pyridoxine 5-phosphate synthase
MNTHDVSARRAIALGVNVDHVATVRQARRGRHPDPVHAALLAEQAGADSITMHLREDRRHIQDRDLFTLQGLMQTHLNLEMAVTDEMVGIALQLRPSDCCLVPEKREEITTEGGLDARAAIKAVRDATQALVRAGIRVSLFVDPEESQLEAAVEAGAQAVELHTGRYAEAQGPQRVVELRRLVRAAHAAAEMGLRVNAGHGLDYHNVQPVAAIPEIVELNIGHALVARALFSGLSTAVRDMKALMLAAR